MKLLSYFIKQLFFNMTTRLPLLLLLSVAAQASAQSRTTTVPQQRITTPSKPSSPKTYASNIPKKMPAIDAKTPKIGETLAVLEDFPAVQLPATPTKRPATTYQQQPKPSNQYSTSTKNGVTTNVKTTTQRSANGSSTMTITTYSGQKTYEPTAQRKPPVTKTVVVPNSGKTVTTYAASTPQTTVRVKNTAPTNAKMPVNAAPTTVRTSLRTPIATTSGATAFSESQRAAANTGAYANYLTSEEKKVLQLINLARTDGNLFLKEYADKYIASNPVFKNNKFAQSLYVDLRKAKGLPPLTPNEKLYRSAKAHATDIGAKGMKGHDSSNGDNFNKRIPRFLSSYSGFGENISYGTDNNTALPIVMLLLIDNNNADYGHRKNILSPSFESIGAAIQQHKTYGFVCVQDFGTGVQ
jgi:uncharacterized protein YkwD